MRVRKLTLKKETVVELTNRELGSVAGGATTTCNTGSYLTCNGPCDSDFQQCLTGLHCLSVTGC